MLSGEEFRAGTRAPNRAAPLTLAGSPGRPELSETPRANEYDWYELVRSPPSNVLRQMTLHFGRKRRIGNARLA